MVTILEIKAMESIAELERQFEQERNSLENASKEARQKDKHGGMQALLDMGSTKLDNSKSLGQLGFRDSGEDKKKAILKYLLANFARVELTDAQVKAIDAITGKSVSSSDLDVCEQFSWLTGSIEDAQKVAKGFKVEIKLDGDSIKAILKHDQNPEKDADLMGKSGDIVAEKEGSDESDPKVLITSADLATAQASATALVESLTRFAIGDVKVKDVLEYFKTNNIENILDKTSKMEKEYTAAKKALTDYAKEIKKENQTNVQSAISGLVEFSQLKITKEARGFTRLQNSDDLEASQVTKLNDLLEKIHKVGTGSEPKGIDKDQTIEARAKIASLMNYLASGKAEHYNVLLNPNSSLSSLSNEKEGKDELVKAFTDKRDAAKKSAADKEVKDADRIKENKREHELFKLAETYGNEVNKIREAISVSEKSNKWFAEEAKKTGFSRAKSYFKSQRAIANPLKAFLGGLVLSASALVASSAVAPFLSSLALSAFAYSAFRFANVYNVASKNKIAMSQVGSQAVSVRSRYEIAIASITTAASVLLPMAGIAKFAMPYLTSTARAVTSAVVGTAIFLKEWSMNRATPYQVAPAYVDQTLGSDEIAAKVTEGLPTETLRIVQDKVKPTPSTPANFDEEPESMKAGLAVMKTLTDNIKEIDGDLKGTASGDKAKLQDAIKKVCEYVKSNQYKELLVAFKENSASKDAKAFMRQFVKLERDVSNVAKRALSEERCQQVRNSTVADMSVGLPPISAS